MNMKGKGNMQGMMKQMQKMQKQMEAAQEKLGEELLEATAGGGMVKVVVSGSKEVVEVIINPEIVDPEDVEILQDLIVIATNEAMAKVEELTNSTMGQFTKGLNIPGM